VPVEFLTDEQAAAYGRFIEEPTRPELERFFFLDDVDRDLIVLRRTTAHQLGLRCSWSPSARSEPSCPTP
jgi:hypothetical protein